MSSTGAGEPKEISPDDIVSTWDAGLEKFQPSTVTINMTKEV
jgi:hypothetical protein